MALKSQNMHLRNYTTRFCSSGTRVIMMAAFRISSRFDKSCISVDKAPQWQSNCFNIELENKLGVFVFT